MELDEEDVDGYLIVFTNDTEDVGANQTEAPTTRRRSNLFIAKVVVQIIILFLALFGNSCLFVVLHRRKRNFTRMHMFITHLCFADILVAFFNILPQLVWEIVGEWKAGDFMCRFIKFMQVFVMYLSTYVLVLTALDRRRAVCSPLLSHTWTYKLVHLSVAAVYLLSAALSVPQAIIFKYQETYPGSGHKNCWVRFYPEWTLQLYITAFTVLVYILPLFVLIYAYGSIYYTIFTRQKQSKKDHQRKYCSDKVNKPRIIIKKNGLRIKELNVPTVTKFNKKNVGDSVVPRSNSFAGFTRAKMKTVKLTLVIILAYIGCWSPFFISQLWWLYDESAPANNSALVIMLLLASLNSCCNPWIYMAFSGSISLRGIATACIRCVKRQSTDAKDCYENQRSFLKTTPSVNTPVTPTLSTTTTRVPQQMFDSTSM